MSDTATRHQPQVPETQTARPEYEPPRITTYTSEEILDRIGPAMACSPDPCPTGG